jgi:hypothetical protein
MKHLFVVFLLIASIIVACTESGVISESFLPVNVDVRIDTFFVDNAEKLEIPAFSTTTIYISAGKYNDALFGSHEAVSYIIPRIGFPAIDTLDVDSLQMTLRLVANPDLVYGDTTQSVEFGLYYINQPWRSGAMQHDDILTTAAEPFKTFTYTPGDTSFVIEMPRDYIEEFASFEGLPDSIRFSRYIDNFNGVALKAVNDANLIVPFFEDSIRYTVLDSPTDSIATSVFGVFRAAYSVDKGGLNTQLIPSGVVPLTFDWKNVYSFNFFSKLKDLGQFNLSSAFLQINEAAEILSNSLPANHIRPEVLALRSFIKRPNEIVFSFVGQTPDFNLIHIDSLNYYNYNMNSINDWKNDETLDTTQVFYIVPNIETGIIYNTLILDQNNTSKFRPRVVLARVEPINEGGN